MNTIIFGITEYKDSKKNILRDFKYIASSSNRALAEAIWRSNHIEIEEIANEMLSNYNVSAIKVINSDTNFVETFKIKNGRSEQFSQTLDLIFIYDKKRVKVGNLAIYTDNEAIFYRSKKTIILLLFKTIVETFTIFVLIFWAFKKLFTDYLHEVEKVVEDKGYIPLDLEIRNSLPILERAFRDVLNNLFLIYFKTEKERLEREKVENEKSPEDEIDEKKSSLISITSERVIQFLNPSEDVLKRFFKEFFIFSKPSRDSSSDLYLFSEIERNREILLLIVDYGNVDGVTSSDISLVLKEVEKDLIVKYSANNRLFALPKILEFVDKKIKSKFAELQIKALENSEFKGLVLHYDKNHSKLSYSSKGVVILKEGENGKFVTYNDYGLYNDRVMQHSMTGEIPIKEYEIDFESDIKKLYILTDGFFKQVKKDKNREEIGKNGFMEILAKVSEEPFSKQGDLFKDEFEKAKGEKTQSDNVTVIGIQI